MSMDSFGETNHEMVSTMRRGHHQLHGSRPPPLRVNNNSSNIMKPRPKQKHHHHPRSPIIVYIKSPKIIHVKPEEFMALVQRLTGRNNQAASIISSSSSSSKQETASKRSHDHHEVDSRGSHEAQHPVISCLAPPGTCPVACPSFCIHVYADWQGLRGTS